MDGRGNAAHVLTGGLSISDYFLLACEVSTVALSEKGERSLGTAAKHPNARVGGGRETGRFPLPLSVVVSVKGAGGHKSDVTVSPSVTQVVAFIYERTGH